MIVRPPPAVHPGDRVGVAALSGPVDPERLEAGLQAVAEMGYEPVEAVNLRTRLGLFAGSDDERLEGFHRLAADPSVRAIIFARGGHGVLRLLPRIDWRLLARHPRAYVGYSDLTPFLLGVVARLGLVAFHGPMVAADLARGLTTAEAKSLRAALGGLFEARLPLTFEAGSEVAEGPILGGCLSMLTATLGTAFAPVLDGAILFFEDVNEPLYRLDRMLTHLRLSGSLNGLKGLIAGHLTCDASAGSASGEPAETLPEHLRELAAEGGWPVAWGLPVGHVGPNLTIPLGFSARLEPTGRGPAAEGSLVIGPRAGGGGAGRRPR